MSVDLAERSTGAERNQSFPYLRPKDAATIVLMDRSAGSLRVLMGRRHHGHKFLPGKFVFPGGRVEAADRRVPVTGELHPIVEHRLMQRVQRPSRVKARAFAVAAIREAFEETGLLLGKKLEAQPCLPEAWSAFGSAGVQPDIGDLHLIARAITPPGRPRRFDTRFFAADVAKIVHRIDGAVGPDAEFVELAWVPIAEAKQLDLPTITHVVLENLEARIRDGFSHELPVPYYRMLNRKSVRVLL
jgi:8-oxo-dGTP pyrophosphatase MutT (NUDIX family)